jgi:hypothetical protein
MEKFLEVLNNPNASPEERRTALAEAVRQAKLDRDLHRNAVAAVGGKPDTIDAHLGRKDGSGAPPPAAGGGGSAKPAGMDDAAILAEAQRSMANATPEQKAQIQQRLQSWGVKGL